MDRNNKNVLFKTRWAWFPAFLLILMLAALGGCASSQKPRGEVPVETRIAPFPSRAGESVCVRVNGGDEQFCENLVTLITATLQSELGLEATEDGENCGIFIDVKVHDIYLAAIDKSGPSASNTLVNTGVGTTLGMGVGSLAGGRGGGLAGAGLGAMLGLGVTFMDSEDWRTWAIDADISLDRKGGLPQQQAYAATAAGSRMSRDQAEEALRTALAEDLAGALR